MLGAWFSGFVVFVIIWWVVFFIVLPFGIRTPDEAPEDADVALEPGQAASAPVRPRIALKFALTTVIASALWGIYAYAVSSGLLALRDIAP
jgi:predicted secreted protein